VTAEDWAAHFALTGTPFSNEEITLKPVVSHCTTYAIPAESTHSALNLGSALNNSDYSDVQFVFPDEGVTCYGHKVILASRSEYFGRLFSCGLKESREEKPVVEIKELSSHTFLAMLKYVYVNDVDFADRSVDLVELLLAAERFQLGGLKKLCEERLTSSFSLPTAIRLLTAFNISEELRNQCISFVLAHWGELEKTDEFRDLMLYYPDLLQEIYGSLAIEECDITGTGDQRLIESKLQENYMRPSSAALRLRNDQQELHDHPLPDVNAIQDNLNPLMWTAKVRSLMGEEIDEGLSAFTLLFNDDYPNDPPLVRFKCNRSHPNVFSDGFLHHGVLSLGWNCTQTVKDILQKVVRVIRQPMAEYPANLHCAQPVGTSTVSAQPVDVDGHQQPHQQQEEEESSMQEALEL
jgi:ubiquitin-protein ligase